MPDIAPFIAVALGLVALAIAVVSWRRVEFAIRLPGRDGENEVLLPIDAKFPQEDYQRLLDAAEQADVEAMATAGRALEQRIRQFAKTIREKYIVPPRTTDFAVLFLPTEGLYAEVLRRPGLFEDLQREHHVTLAGPTTLTALLNALQMGFRSVAIEKRSSEVWQVLGAVRFQFEKYNDVVEGLGRNLGTAANSVKELARRTRVMNGKLKGVETLRDFFVGEKTGRWHVVGQARRWERGSLSLRTAPGPSQLSA
jgi:DNA recombination protein RmuC